MSVLFLTTVLPAGRRGGGEIVSQSLVDALRAAGHEPPVLGYRRAGVAAPHGAGEICVGYRPIETSTARHRAVGWMGRAVASRAPYSVTKYRSRAYLRAVREAGRPAPAVVIADHAQLHFALHSGVLPAAPLVFVAHNAEAEVYGRLASSGDAWPRRWANAREARLIRAAEADLARRARQVWVLTDEDRDYFHALAPEADVRVLEVASMISEPPQAGAPTCDVALLGSWSWGANARGLEWFAGEVMPHVPGGVSVQVGGPGAEWLEGRYANLTVRGPVPDAERFLLGGRVVAIPSTEGGGVQVKTLDALACGAPVVATTPATRGLSDLPGAIVVADDAEQFAGHLARLAAAPRLARLREDALAWSGVRQERLRETVAAWIGELLGEGDDSRAPVAMTRAAPLP